MQRTETGHWKSSEVARLLALVESERRYYQDLFAALPVAVAIVSEDQTLVAVNREFRQRFGLVHEDLSRVRVADLLPDPALERGLAELLAGEHRRASYEIQAGPRQIRVALKKINGWQDTPEAEILMTVEETGEGAPVAVPAATGTVAWRLDRESGRMVCLSANAEQSFGLPAEAWQTLEDWAATRIHPADRGMYLSFYERQEDEWTGAIDYRLIGADATVRSCRDVAAADAESVVGLTIDRSEDVRAARKARLEARAEASEKMAARLAHVANNLMMIVGGYSAELMDSLAEGDTRRGDIQEIINASNRLAALTAQMNPMAAQRSAEAAGGFSLSRWAQSRGAVLDGPDALVEAGETAVTALSDAVVQTAGEVRLSVSYSAEVEQAEIRFVFPGKSELEAEGLLDPFAGPKIGSDPPYGPMKPLKRLMEAGAEAWVEERAEGACLVVVLPAESAAEAPLEKQAPSAPSYTVLLVEDEDGLRALLVKALRRAGYEVLEAASAEAALEALELRRARFDLLATDLTLPGMGGGKLAMEVRWLYPETPVVFMTGSSEDAEAAALMKSDSGVKLLNKPFAVDALVQAVSAALDVPRARGASAGG
jgi:CheY-like chemotaxis protein/PAS domain-containing protein